MSATTLFTIARTWKHLKCPLTEEWIKKMWYIYTINLLFKKIIQSPNSILSKWPKVPQCVRPTCLLYPLLQQAEETWLLLTPDVVLGSLAGKSCQFFKPQVRLSSITGFSMENNNNIYSNDLQFSNMLLLSFNIVSHKLLKRPLRYYYWSTGCNELKGYSLKVLGLVGVVFKIEHKSQDYKMLYFILRWFQGIIILF